jgi:hypothetical protein
MITIRTLYFFGFLAIFLIAILATGAHYYLRNLKQQKYPYGKWDELLKRLGSLDHNNLALIAGSFNNDSDMEDEELDPEQLWHLLGGMQGLEVVEKNCAVLVDLVFYVQQWYPEAMLVAEQLRQNAREVQWHIDRIKSAAKIGKPRSATPEYVQQAVAIYYRMTCQVLTLYEQANVPGLADLQGAL